MVQQITIDVQARDRAGKGAARATRRAGRVPAVIYGARQDPVMVSLDPRDLRKRLDAGTFFSTVYEMKVGNGAERVLARDVQFHPVSDMPLHVDFLRVTAETKVTIEVPCHFLNEEESPGLKRGGVLNIVRHEVEVLCAVDAIPHAFEIDLTGLEIGDSVHISHVNLPEGVVPTITDRDFTIATIAAPTVVAEEQGGEAPSAEPVTGMEEEGAEAEEQEGGEKEE